MKVTMVVLKLLFLGALFIVSNHDLYLKNTSDRGVFVHLYTSWLNNLFYQGFEVTSYVVKFEWLPALNETSLKK